MNFLKWNSPPQAEEEREIRRKVEEQKQRKIMEKCGIPFLEGKRILLHSSQAMTTRLSDKDIVKVNTVGLQAVKE
jgi:hypothetical protein